MSRAGREAADAGEADESDSDDEEVRTEDRAREEAMRAALDARCFSGLFIDPACITYQSSHEPHR